MASNTDYTQDMSKKRLSTKQVVLICSGGFAVVLIIIGICVMLSPFGQYNLGISALNKGKYESAVKHLTAAGAYRDAQVHLVEATTAWNYQLAQQAFSSEDYATAVEKYSLIPGYLDADEQLIVAQTCYHYQQGNLLYENGDYLGASEEYLLIPDYLDSATKLDQSYYSYAQEEETAGDYVVAAEYYAMADSCEDSSERIYNCGVQLLEAEEYRAAADVFESTNYDNARDMGRYASGWANYEEGNYSAATEFFRVASGIKDADAMRIDSAYHAGVEAMEDEDYDDAKEYFIAASGFEDADIMRLDCELMLAEELYDEGRLHSAREAFQALPCDLEYNGILVAQRLDILEQYSVYVDLCGTWQSTHNYMSSICYYTYHSEGWTVDDENGGFLEIFCVIEDDGSVTIRGRITYDVFTGYTSIRDYMIYYCDSRSYTFTIENASLGDTWDIRSTATLSYSNGAFYLRDFDDDNPMVGVREEYTTEVTYGSLPDYERF